MAEGKLIIKVKGEKLSSDGTVIETRATINPLSYEVKASELVAGTNTSDVTPTLGEQLTSITNEANEKSQTALDLANDTQNTAKSYAEQAGANADQTTADRIAVSQDKETIAAYKISVEASENNAAESAERALNNILNGVSTHNFDDAAHPFLLGDIQRVEAIARGRATAQTFDTYDDMITWLAVPENVQKLITGDNLYIRAVNVKDYWWDGTTYQPLESECPDLANYYTKTQVDNLLPITIEQTNYDVLVTAGTITAGRIYYVVPDGTLGE